MNYEPFFTTLRTFCTLLYRFIHTQPRVKKYESYYSKCNDPMKILSGGLKSFPPKLLKLFVLVLIHVLLINVLIIFSLYSLIWLINANESSSALRSVTVGQSASRSYKCRNRIKRNCWFSFHRLTTVYHRLNLIFFSENGFLFYMSESTRFSRKIYYLYGKRQVW